MTFPVHAKISNFQSIEELDLEINGFTICVGKTNIGKSAIIRAISGALLNKPVTNLVRTGTKFVTVQLQSENWGFTWDKSEPSEGVNQYKIDGKSEALTKIGQGQIEHVAQMGFGSIRVGNKEQHPWYASQWDPIFLLNETGPAVTEFISDISRLKVLQDAIQIALRGKKKTHDESKIATADLIKLRKKEQAVGDVPALAAIIKELDEQQISISYYEDRIEKAEKLQADLQKSKACIEALLPHKNAIVEDVNLDDSIVRIRRMYELWRALQGTAKKVIVIRAVKQLQIPESPQIEATRFQSVSRYKGVSTGIKKVSKLDLALKQVKLPDVSSINEDVVRFGLAKKHILEIAQSKSKLVRLQAQIPKLPELSVDVGKIQRIGELRAQIQVATSSIHALAVDREETMRSLDKTFKELAEIPNCPTCGQPTNFGEHRELEGDLTERTSLSLSELATA